MDNWERNHDGWHPLKKNLEARTDHRNIYFYEREIWYCSIGHNIGFEQDGKDSKFWRPIVIIKKYGPNLFMGVPLTSRIKDLPFYFDIGIVAGVEAMAIVSQIRPLSPKRLANKIETMTTVKFEALKKATQDYIFK